MTIGLIALIVIVSKHVDLCWIKHGLTGKVKSLRISELVEAENAMQDVRLNFDHESEAIKINIGGSIAGYLSCDSVLGIETNLTDIDSTHSAFETAVAALSFVAELSQHVQSNHEINTNQNQGQIQAEFESEQSVRDSPANMNVLQSTTKVLDKLKNELLSFSSYKLLTETHSMFSTFPYNKLDN